MFTLLTGAQRSAILLTPYRMSMRMLCITAVLPHPLPNHGLARTVGIPEGLNSLQALLISLCMRFTWSECQWKLLSLIPVTSASYSTQCCDKLRWWPGDSVVTLWLNPGFLSEFVNRPNDIHRLQWGWVGFLAMLNVCPTFQLDGSHPVFTPTVYLLWEEDTGGSLWGGGHHTSLYSGCSPAFTVMRSLWKRSFQWSWFTVYLV